MRRMRELINQVKVAYPKDTFFDSLDETLRLSSQARTSYRAYDRALSCLDQDCWTVLSQKAVAHFIDHREGQLKQGFFNQLNEAFGYQYLIRQGCSNVRLLPEDGTKTPDIQYQIGPEIKFCEVKTIGFSQEEIARCEAQQVFDNSVYRDLSPGFLNKVSTTVTQAYSQILSKGKSGLVFVVAKFDDFTLAHYDRYREQLVELLAQHDVPEVHIKIGLFGCRRVHNDASVNWIGT